MIISRVRQNIDCKEGEIELDELAESKTTKEHRFKVVKWIDDHFEESLLILLLATMACVELVQVIARNVPFIASLTWAEEFCRFTWVATVFLSLPYTIRTMTTLRVTALVDVLPWKVQNIVNVLVDIVNAIILAVLAFYSVGVTDRIVSSGETSPAMLMPMWILYAVVIAGFALGAIRAVQMCIIHIKGINVEPKDALEAQVEEELRVSGMDKMAERVSEKNADPDPFADAGKPRKEKRAAAKERSEKEGRS